MISYFTQDDENLDFSNVKIYIEVHSRDVKSSSMIKGILSESFALSFKEWLNIKISSLKYSKLQSWHINDISVTIKGYQLYILTVLNAKW